jgi:transcriptional regulator with XRE-family HTH domain
VGGDERRGIEVLERLMGEVLEVVERHLPEANTSAPRHRVLGFETVRRCTVSRAESIHDDKPTRVNGGGPALQAEDVLLPAELRARRQTLGLTQARLAALLGVTSTTVARWERMEQRIGHPERVSAALARLDLSAPQNGVAAAASLERPRHNLPAQLSSFVGREQDVLYVEGLLAGTRLLTLTGTGGIGKTRMALQVGAELLPDYPDGVWLVELAPLTDPGLVARAVALLVLGLNSLSDALRDALDPRSGAGLGQGASATDKPG